jgi:hypothetical protein
MRSKLKLFLVGAYEFPPAAALTVCANERIENDRRRHNVSMQRAARIIYAHGLRKKWRAWRSILPRRIMSEALPLRLPCSRSFYAFFPFQLSSSSPTTRAKTIANSVRRPHPECGFLLIAFSAWQRFGAKFITFQTSTPREREREPFRSHTEIMRLAAEVDGREGEKDIKNRNTTVHLTHIWQSSPDKALPRNIKSQLSSHHDSRSDCHLPAHSPQLY